MSLLLLMLFSLPSASLQQREDPCQVGVIQVQEGNLKQAESYLRACVDARPNELIWLLRLCSVYQETGNDEQLYNAALEGVARFPDERRFYMTAGIRAASGGDMDEAVSLFSRASERFPDDQAIRENLVQVYLVRGMNRLDGGMETDARLDLVKALELEPRNAEALLNLGRVDFNLLNSEKAFESFEQAREISPGIPMIQFHRGVSLHSLGRFQEAYEALSEEITGDPSSSTAYYFRGLALKSLGRWTEALSDLEIAAVRMPDYRDVFYQKGRCEEHLGFEPSAERSYRKALKLGATDPRGFLALGQLLRRQGRGQEAKELLDRARDLYRNMVKEDQATFRFKSTGNSELRR